MKQFVVRAAFDPEAGVWWASNDELPLTTEAASFEDLMDRAAAIAPEMAEMNGLAAKGEKVSLTFTTDRTVTVAD